jgi:hypothetical protein
MLQVDSAEQKKLSSTTCHKVISSEFGVSIAGDESRDQSQSLLEFRPDFRHLEARFVCCRYDEILPIQNYLRPPVDIELRSLGFWPVGCQINAVLASWRGFTTQ